VEHKLFIFYGEPYKEKGSHVYLANPTNSLIERIVVSSFAKAYWSDDGSLVLTNTVYCEIKNLPPHSYCKFEEFDIYEDGKVMYSIKMIKWQNTEERKIEIDLNTKRMPNEFWRDTVPPKFQMKESKCLHKLLEPNSFSNDHIDNN